MSLFVGSGGDVAESTGTVTNISVRDEIKPENNLLTTWEG